MRHTASPDMGVFVFSAPSQLFFYARLCAILFEPCIMYGCNSLNVAFLTPGQAEPLHFFWWRDLLLAFALLRR